VTSAETDSTVAGRPLRVVVADDHPVFRDGLQMTLDDEPDITVVAAVADGDAAVAEIA
jgi:DNA-binding NarL/FixJ family response regulator